MVSARKSQKSTGLRLVRGTPKSESSRAPGGTDDDLVSALERGEPLAAGLLYDHLLGAVEAALYRVRGQRGPDHDDLVQNTFEQIVITLRKKRFARACSLRSWAASIGTHVALNSLRSRRTHGKYFDLGVSVGEESGGRAPDNPERDAQLTHDLSIMRRELASLPPEQARTLLLHDAFGYELSEISVLTNASVAAAQSRLVRGRKKLRERLIEAGVKVREES